jgi:hypothetical protein
MKEVRSNGGKTLRRAKRGVSLALEWQHTTSSCAAAARPPRLFGAIAALLLYVALLLHAASGERAPDFTSYDTPVYQQIAGRIHAKIAARLAGVKETHDRFFIVAFAYENHGNNPALSHSFISVVRVSAGAGATKAAAALPIRDDEGRRFEAITISWLPSNFRDNPHLCIVEGFGGRVFPQLNRCPVVPGRNFNLQDTIHFAARSKLVVGMWGPYEATRAVFDLAMKRKALLDSGAIKYRADDRPYRKNHAAINCFHALGNLDDVFPNGGFLRTGCRMWGLHGTAQVLLGYITDSGEKGVLLDRVEVKKECYGFVYVATRGARQVYNPFKAASAYYR